MKQTLLTLIAALFCTFAGAQQSRYDQVVDLIRSKGYALSVDQGNGYVDLKQGEVGYVWKQFHAGDSYLIVAFSDDGDVKDMDVFVEDEDGNVITKDDDASSIAVVAYDPSATTRLKVRYKNYNSSTPNYESRCRLLIAYKE